MHTQKVSIPATILKWNENFSRVPWNGRCWFLYSYVWSFSFFGWSSKVAVSFILFTFVVDRVHLDDCNQCLKLWKYQFAYAASTVMTLTGGSAVLFERKISLFKIFIFVRYKQCKRMLELEAYKINECNSVMMSKIVIIIIISLIFKLYKHSPKNSHWCVM